MRPFNAKSENTEPGNQYKVVLTSVGNVAISVNDCRMKEKSVKIYQNRRYIGK